MANVGKNIKKIRTRKKMTQDELAEKLFVSRQTISNYENNKSNPDIETLKKIADILGVDANTLIYGEKSFSEKKEIIEKYGPKFIGLGVAAIVIYMISSFLIASNLHVFQYYIGLTHIPYNSLWPFWYMALGWIIMDILCFIWDVQIFKRKYVKLFRGIVIFCVLLYVVMVAVMNGYMIYECLKEFHQNSNIIAYGGLYSVDETSVLHRFAYHVFWSTQALKPYFFVIPGLILRAAKREIKEKIQ